MSKNELMQQLIDQLALVEFNNFQKDKQLVNQFKLHKEIPNKWFDWERRVNAPIMIIGQDWGPYVALKKYVERYENEKNNFGFSYGKFLMEGFSSRTEKFVLTAIEKTYREKYSFFNPEVTNLFFFTMAVLFTRPGKHFRGSKNFDEKKSFELSYHYVSKQIDIVKPKIIMTLGNLGLQTVSRHFNLGLEKKKITQLNKELNNDVIRVDNTIIIPNFHPAAHVSPTLQLKNWSKIWEYLYE